METNINSQVAHHQRLDRMAFFKWDMAAGASLQRLFDIREALAKKRLQMHHESEEAITLIEANIEEVNKNIRIALYLD